METLNKFLKIAKDVYRKELTINEYFENLKAVEEAEAEIKAELKTKTVKILKSVNYQLGNYTDSRHKKEDLINKAHSALIDYFLIGRPVSYFLGEGTHQDAQNKLIQGTTAQDLEKFYSKRREEQERVNKSCENPETLSEYREFISQRGKDKLSPEQLETFERLQADLVLKRQEEEQTRQATINKIENENVEFALHETKHSKTGADIFTVLMINRIEKEEFNALRSKAKKLGGYYSRFTNNSATPPIKAGFNFDTLEDANNFIGLKEQAQDTTEKAEAREEEKQQTAGERMKERAENMIEKAEESLNQDRRTNTHRQASQAANSEGKARAEIIFAKKLIKISEGFDNGNIKYLHKLRNGKQLEQLESILSQARHARQRAQNLTYTEKQNEERKPLEDVNFVEYPYPVFYMEMVKSLLLPYSDTKGMKQGVQKILKNYATKKQSENDKIILKGEYVINLFKKTASKIPDVWEKDRILNPIRDFERIQKLGLTTESILKTALRELIHLSEGTQTSPEEIQKIEMLELERSFITKKIEGFFPTPQPLIDRMFAMAKVFKGETVREPSAGLGHIAEQIRLKYPENDLVVNEINYSLTEVLEKKGFKVSDHGNFLNETEKTDVIFMNPPFEKNQDIDHVRHAFNLLKPEGRLVAIMAGNKHENSRNSKIIEFLQMVEEYGYIQENEQGSFKSAFNSTNVNTIIVYLEKPEEAEQEPEEAQEIEVTEAETVEPTPEPMQCNEVQLSFF
jgi:hypothetical protein